VRKVGIDGLDRALLLQRISRWPVIGQLISIVWQIRNLPITVARLEAQERRLFGAEEELRAAIDAVAQTGESLLNALSDRSADATGTLSGSLRKMDREKASRAQVVALTSRLAAMRFEISKLFEHSHHHANREELLQIVESLVTAMAQLDQRKVDIEVPDPDFDKFYLAFENTFRGTREDIRERMAVYLPIVKSAGVDAAPVVDIGCGRGEWLELLKESGVEARGVDMNPRMAQECRELGLEIVEADAVDYLGTLAAGSVSAVTGMHIVEHLPYRRVLKLLDEARRVLRPGGVAILETPNPENVIVGSCNFWYDPTHERPLPPEPLKRAAELRGFARVEILRLHPFPAIAHFTSASGVRDQLNHLFYGPQDYAIVAYKAAEEGDR
jgi:SAM-dependent methyltransferase